MCFENSPAFKFWQRLVQDFWQSYKCRPSTSWASAPDLPSATVDAFHRMNFTDSTMPWTEVVCSASDTWDLHFRGKRSTPKPEIFGSWTSSLFGVRPSSRAATAPGGHTALA